MKVDNQVEDSGEKIVQIDFLWKMKQNCIQVVVWWCLMINHLCNKYHEISGCSFNKFQKY